MSAVPAIITLELSAEVLEGIKAVSGIKTFIILALASFRFAIMPWGKCTGGWFYT